MHQIQWGASFAVAFLLTACGGGGGGGGGSGTPPATPLVYTGSISAAVVTPTNAARLADNLLGTGDTTDRAGSLAGISVASQTHSADRLTLAGAIRELRRSLSESAAQLRGQPRTRSAVVPVNSTQACNGGGTRTLSGTLNDNGTGTLNVTYNACHTAPSRSMTGSASMRIDAFDLSRSIITDGFLSFTRMTMRAGGSTWDLTGTSRQQVTASTNTQVSTDNYVVLNSATGQMLKAEDLVEVDVSDNVAAPTNFTRVIGGRIYDNVHGVVTITTAVTLRFASDDDDFPQSGEVLLTGAGNRTIRATALSTSTVRLHLDVNGDGAVDHAATLRWIDMPGSVGSDLADSDGDGMHNSWETVYGLNLSDPADANLDRDGDGANNRREYMAGSLPNNAASLPSVAQLVNVPANSDIVFDALRQRIYAAVKGSPGSVVPIDVDGGEAQTAIPVGIDPSKLALSDDAQYLYVGLGGESKVQRIDLASGTIGLEFPLGSSSLSARFAEDMQVLPGAPQSVAISLRNAFFSPRHEGVAIYDNGVARASMTGSHTGANRIEFSSSAGTLYGYNNETTGFGFYRLTVNASGVSVLDVFDSFMGDLIQGFGVDIHFAGGRIYTTTGRIIDPVARSLLGTFALPTVFGPVVVVADPSVGRAFFAAQDPAGNTITVRAFDINTRLELGSLTIPSTIGNPGSIIRWGAKGLALRTDGGQVFLIQTPALIP